MPRKPRINAPGAMHHIIARGIERCKLFRDDADCNNFLDRLGGIINDTGTVCFAWVLIPNHFDLLFRTGLVPNATVAGLLLNRCPRQRCLRNQTSVFLEMVILLNKCFRLLRNNWKSTIDYRPKATTLKNLYPGL